MQVLTLEVGSDANGQSWDPFCAKAIKTELFDEPDFVTCNFLEFSHFWPRSLYRSLALNRTE